MFIVIQILQTSSGKHVHVYWCLIWVSKDYVNNLLQLHWFDDEDIPLNLADVEITDESDSDEN